MIRQGVRGDGRGAKINCEPLYNYLFSIRVKRTKLKRNEDSKTWELWNRQPL